MRAFSKIIFLLMILLINSVLARPKPVKCNGHAELPLKEEQSVAALKAELTAKARLNAISSIFGTALTSIQTSAIKSNFKNDSSMTDAFQQFSQSIVKGFWVGDISSPTYINYIGQDGKPWMRAEISGYAFSAVSRNANNKVFVSSPGLNTPKTNFTVGECFSIHFETMNSGLLSVFIETNFSDTVFVLDGQGIYINQGNEVIIPEGGQTATGKLIFTGSEMNEPSIHRFHFLFKPNNEEYNRSTNYKSSYPVINLLTKKEFYSYLLDNLTNKNSPADYEVSDITVNPK